MEEKKIAMINADKLDKEMFLLDDHLDKRNLSNQEIKLLLRTLLDFLAFDIATKGETLLKKIGEKNNGN